MQSKLSLYMSSNELNVLNEKIDKIASSLHSVSESLKDLKKTVDEHNIGIRGNETHGIDSYANRFKSIEDQLSDLTDFKKKIIYLATFVSSTISLFGGFLVWLINRIFGSLSQ